MPDTIYKNKNGKRGDYMFAKKMGEHIYVASIEVAVHEAEDALYAVSIFRVRKTSYLDSYELIWSWKGGEPSS